MALVCTRLQRMDGEEAPQRKPPQRIPPQGIPPQGIPPQGIPPPFPGLAAALGSSCCPGGQQTSGRRRSACERLMPGTGGSQGWREQPRDGQERNSSRRSAAGAQGCPRRAGADHPAGAHQWFPTPRGGHMPRAPGEATNGSEPSRQHPKVQGSARRGATGWGEPRGAGERCRQRWVGVPVRGGLTCGRSLPRGSAGAR